MTAPEKVPAGERLLHTPEEAAHLLGIGRTKVYRLIATDELHSVRIGGSRRITNRALSDFVHHLDAGGPVDFGTAVPSLSCSTTEAQQDGARLRTGTD